MILIGSRMRFLVRVSPFESFKASPKHPQSSTGSQTADTNVIDVKMTIATTAKIEINGVRTLNSSMHPIISSAPQSQMAKPNR